MNCRNKHQDKCSCNCNDKVPYGFYGNNKCILYEDYTDIKKALWLFKGKKIQIITGATPPAAKPPNITGKLIHVDDKILKLKLKSEHDDSTKEGIYFLKSIIGFIPLEDEEDGGCGKEKDPMSSLLTKYIGERVNLLVANTSSTTTGSDVKGIILEVNNDFVKIQLDQTTPTTNPLIATYSLSQVTGVIGLSSKTTGGKGSSSKGKVTVQVTIDWVGSDDHPEEVKVNFMREDVITTIPTINGVATFSCEPTGSLIIQGEDIAGFITPTKEIRLPGNVPFIFETLDYISDDVPVTGVLISPPDLKLLLNDKFKLDAQVLPLNASNQEITWQSNNEEFVSVDSNGVVTGNSQGSAAITAKSVEDESYFAQATVDVLTIDSIIDKSDINAILGEVILLPDTVNVKLSDSSIMTLPVTWKYNNEDVGATFTPTDSTTSEYTLIGIVDKTTLTASLNIIVNTNVQAIQVTGLSLNIISTSIYIGDITTIIPIFEPNNATTKDVTFASLDSSVAIVSDSGVVKGVSTGFTTIVVTTVDGNFKAYCIVSVSMVPEIDLIYSIETVYDSYEDVEINVENLITARVTSKTKYYIKVEQTGNDSIVGEGEVYLEPGMTTFKPYYHTTFNPSPNYNNQYFLYMSTNKNFPKSDEQTLSTNFKIDSAVPTIDPEDIKVDLEIIGGYLDNNPSDIIFILARELDKPIEDITWKDYVVDLNDDEIEFTDEVKLKGKTDENGVVIWEEPKETLKLGGYVLLEVTPNGYIDNLNLINPDSSDEELIKIVHLTRDGIIVRHVINTFTGI